MFAFAISTYDRQTRGQTHGHTKMTAHIGRQLRMQLSWTGTAFKGRASPGHLRSHLLFPQMTDIQTQKTRLLEIPVPGIEQSLICIAEREN